MEWSCPRSLPYFFEVHNAQDAEKDWSEVSTRTTEEASLRGCEVGRWSSQRGKAKEDESTKKYWTAICVERSGE